MGRDGPHRGRRVALADARRRRVTSREDRFDRIRPAVDEPEPIRHDAAVPPFAIRRRRA